MSDGMTLAPDHTNYMTVYDMTDATSVDDATVLGDSDYIVEIGEKSNTFELTIPDGKYIKVVYWAKFEGSAGKDIEFTNTAEYYYEGNTVNNTGSAWKNSLKVSFSNASAWAQPYIYVSKTNQSGNAMEGVEFAIYKVTKNADGTVTLPDEPLATQTTDANGKLFFGTLDGVTHGELDHDSLYCIVETDTPAGYKPADNYYFEMPDIYDRVDGEFVANTEKENNHVATHPNGITVNDMMPGMTIGIINSFAGPNYEIPVNKTINGENAASGVEFTFTLKQTSGTAYTDADFNTALSSNGITLTSDGSKAKTFDKLYFAEPGIYKFTLTENDLDSTAKKAGFTKDDTTYIITIEVAVNEQTKGVEVTRAIFSDGDMKSGDLLKGDVPTFDNTLKKTSTVTFTAGKKAINNWAKNEMPEFEFELYRNDTKIATGTNAADGTISFTDVELTQDYFGANQAFVIKEVKGNDQRFTYSETPLNVYADIAIVNGELAVTKISYDTDDDGNDIDTITNEYSATGTLTLTGTKYLKGPNGSYGNIRKGEFTFSVMEGDTEVATGATKKGSGETGAEIDFTTITYHSADIGEHTYVIKENDLGEMFQEYDAADVTVVVNVTDDGEGNLTAEVTSVKVNDNEVENKKITFTNTCTYIVPTGINLDTLPYVLVLVFALCGGAALVLSRRKRRQSKQH
jgi:pilin isopeptide linkage protein